MCRFAENADFIGFQLLFQCLIATSSMRVENVFRLFVAILHRLCNLCILVCRTANQGCDGFMIAFVKVIDTCEVAWVSHIHCVGERLERSFRFVNACLKVIIEDVICIICSDKALDWKSHLMSEKCCADISKITRRHTDDEFFILLAQLLLDACIGIEIIESLWKESSHIDGIG